MMRERLIELIRAAMAKSEEIPLEDCVIPTSDYLANYLLANGVIVLPCKVGDTVYELDTLVNNDKCENCEFYYEGGMGDYPACEKGRCGNRTNDCIEIEEVVVTQKALYWWLCMDDFGKTVFLTREEAEKALKEGRTK